ncbi:MAG: Hpt domain-containing protein [Gammaproteobacteria bacterium]
MASVSSAISEELSRVKDALDIFMRGGDATKIGDLAPHLPTLRQVADTIAMLGLGQQRKLVLEQHDILEGMVRAGKLDDPARLMDVAGSLLYVEATLQGMGDKQQASLPDSPQDALTQDEINRARDAVIRECRAGLEFTKEKIVEYIASQWARDHIELVPGALTDVRGGLQIIAFDRAAAILARAVDFIQGQLLSEDAAPDWKRMDTLADAISSVEYFLERAVDDASGSGHILDIAEKALVDLGYPVGAAAVEEAVVDRAVPEAPRTPSLEDEYSEELDAEPTLDVPMTAAEENILSFADEEPAVVANEDVVAAPMPVEMATPEDVLPLAVDWEDVVAEGSPDLDAGEVGDAGIMAEATEDAVEAEAVVEVPDAGLDTLAGSEPPAMASTAAGEEGDAEADTEAASVDEEIVEIFVEEIGEVMEKLDEFFPQWVANQQDEESLREFRRAFHTLKGSGRMVGAKYVGELAWSIENMLNRVIDKSVVPTPAMIELIRTVRAIAPELVDAFAQRRKPPYVVEPLMECANAFARGESPADVPPLQRRGARAVEAAPAADYSLDAEPVARAGVFATEEIVEIEDVVLPESIAAEQGSIPVEYAGLVGDAESELSAGIVVDALPLMEAGDVLPDADSLAVEEFLEADDNLPEASLLVDEADSPEGVDEITLEDVVPAAEDVSAAAPDLDAALMEVFSAESAQHLDSIDAWLASLDPDLSHYPVQDDLLRALHTLKGSARMAGIFAVADIAAPTEHLCKELRNNGELADADIVALVRDAASLVRQMVAQLETDPHAVIPGAEGFLARLSALQQRRHLLADASVEDAGGQAVQPRPGVINDLLAEGIDHVLDGADYAAQWSQQGTVAEALDAMCSECARLDAAAQRAGIAPLAQLAQRLDIVYDAVRSGRLMLATNVVGALQQAHEAVVGMMDCMAALQSVWPATDAEHALDAVISMIGPAVDIPQPDVVQVQEQPEAEAQDFPEAMVPGDVLVAEEAAIGDDFAFSAEDLAEAEEEVIEASGSVEPLAVAFEEKDAGWPVEPAVPQVLEADTAGEVVAEAAALTAAELAEEDVPPEIPDRDPELVEIFLEEADEIVESAAESLETWISNVDDTIEVQKLQRDLHTLKGGARMAEVAELGDLAHELENLYEGLSHGTLSATPALFALLHRCHDRIGDMVVQIRGKGWCRAGTDLINQIHAYIRDPENFVAEVSGVALKPAVADPAPAGELPAVAQPSVLDVGAEGVAPGQASPPSTVSVAARESVEEDVSSTVDADILEIFLEEAEDLTAQLDTAIAGWRAEPTHMAHADELKRVLHTLKGGARLAGLKRLGDISHQFETRVIDLGPARPDEAFFGRIAGYHDEIVSLVERVREGGAAAATAPAPAVEAEEPRHAAPQASGSPTPVVQGPAVERPDVDEARRAPAPATAAARQAQPQEMVKVPADLLEKLVNLAGETSINRGRIEQQTNDFRYSLQEMGSTIARLAEQLRRLNAEADEQVKANWEAGRAEGKYSGDFDPLEMDQYSQLHQLTKQLFESASDLLDIRDTLVNKSRDTETLLLQQSRVNTELQEGLMRSRMVPFSRLIPRLRRIVRQVAGELKKNIEIEFINPEGEMDRALLERMVAPLEHMLRNACDHGVEAPDVRAAAGKSAQGRIRLALSREGGEVVLTIADDGKGVNVNAVRKKAMERGMMDETSDLSDQEIMQFILEAGFSTAEKVTQISGRGVGMDVVSSEIKQMGGALSIRSEPGHGTTFEIRLPFTVSVNRALMVRVGEDQFAIPLVQIEGIVRVSPYELESYYQPDAPAFEYAGENYRLNYLGGFVHSGAVPDLAGVTMPLPVLLVRGSEHTVAIQVDQLIGSREVVVKAVGPQLSTVAGISGATILGDGRVVIILDLMSLIRASHLQHEMLLAQQRRAALQAASGSIEPQVAAVRETPLIMVTDDSVTVRKVTGRFLERQGFEVVTAKDGMDAVAQLADIKPDLMLLDIEMPRMDGFEVASHCRHDSRLKDLPIIMITSRTGEKHRERALEIGVNAYMGKPFQESELLAKINELLAERRARALN